MFLSRTELGICYKNVLLLADFFKQHFCNFSSERDEGRDIPGEDFLFPLNSERKLIFGKNREELNIVILIPKSEKRASPGDVSLSHMIKNRVDPSLVETTMKKYEYKNSGNIKKMKIFVEIFDLSNDTMLGHGLSEEIKDKQSAAHGSFELNNVTPQVSCEKGGRLIQMTTEQNISSTIVPVFQLLDSNGARIPQHDELLSQPKNVQYHQRTVIRFYSPEQPNFRKIQENMWTIQIKLKRTGCESESTKSDLFNYYEHKLASLSPNGDCLFCSPSGLAFIDGGNQISSMLPAKTAPNKRRRLSTKQSSPAAKRVILQNPKQCAVAVSPITYPASIIETPSSSASEPIDNQIDFLLIPEPLSLSPDKEKSDQRPDAEKEKTNDPMISMWKPPLTGENMEPEPQNCDDVVGSGHNSSLNTPPVLEDFGLDLFSIGQIESDAGRQTSNRQRYVRD